MKLLFSFVFLSFAVGAANAATQDQEIVAQPISRQAPDYPELCMPQAGETKDPQEVTVLFSVNKEGFPENVRAIASTDDCYEDAAVAAVRGWRYEPRRVNGRKREQSDLETTFIFEIAKQTQALDFDARPLLRKPPRYPESCMRRADSSESVTVQFDVTAEGITQNIEVIDSTNDCFNKTAMRAVEEWIYRPKIVAGEAQDRTGVQTVITYQLDSDVDPQMVIRRTLVNKLNRVQRYTRNDNPDLEAAFRDLEEIEERFGRTFTRAELSAFHEVRAVVRLAAKDYAGALDDLRVVQRTYMRPDTEESIGKAIIQLERVFAGEQPDDADAALTAPDDIERSNNP